MMQCIDCVRGYAVVLVILCHLVYAYPGIPYPVHRLATFGWHGVQLFFLASAVTLLLSWHAEVARHGRASFGRFLIRRVFRIAPAYFAAAMGRVSFSAYLLHYAVILMTIDAYPALFHTGATGWLAIAAFAAGCIVVLGVVFLLSWCSFQLVERPMIRLGGKVARLRWPAVAHAR